MTHPDIQRCAEQAGLGGFSSRKLIKFVRLLHKCGRLDDGSVLPIKPIRFPKAHLEAREAAMRLLEELP